MKAANDLGLSPFPEVGHGVLGRVRVHAEMGCQTGQ
jgi:hypothetical protein